MRNSHGCLNHESGNILKNYNIDKQITNYFDIYMGFLAVKVFAFN